MPDWVDIFFGLQAIHFGGFMEFCGFDFEVLGLDM